ncbi:MAG: hypothetical protein IPO21_00800 [Bacteroidales bacterium]|nr:hypothetical protein [Bacteroidales bacterium]
MKKIIFITLTILLFSCEKEVVKIPFLPEYRCVLNDMKDEILEVVFYCTTYYDGYIYSDTRSKYKNFSDPFDSHYLNNIDTISYKHQWGFIYDSCKVDYVVYITFRNREHKNYRYSKRDTLTYKNSVIEFKWPEDSALLVPDYY